MFNKDVSYLVFDIETTGLDILWDTPTQLAWQLYEGTKLVDEQMHYVKTKNPLNADIVKFTGITDEILKSEGKDPKKVIALWQAALAKSPDVVVGHNVLNFDYPMITNWQDGVLAPQRFRLPSINMVYDTMNAARKKFGTKKWLKLSVLADKFGIEWQEDKLHDALYDVSITAKCFQKLIGIDGGDSE